MGGENHRLNESACLAPYDFGQLYVGAESRDQSLLNFLNFYDRELSIHAVGLKLDLVTRFDGLEHREVLDAEDHRHPVVHVELLDWSVPNRDLASRFVDFRHLAIN